MMSTPLHFACKKIKDEKILISVIDILINAGANIEAKNKKRETPLVIACQHNELDIVKHLVELGANIESKCYYGCTPLFFACEEDKIDIVDYLLDMGANINAVSEKGESILIYCQTNNCMKKLIDRGADIKLLNNNPDRHVLRDMFPDNMDMIKLLMEHGLDVDVAVNYDNDPFLAVALWDGYYDHCEYFLSMGADINIGHGYLLSKACREGDEQCIVWLVEHGADVNIRCREGYTILRHAVDSEYLKEHMIDFLIENGARMTPDGKDWYEYTGRKRR